MSLRREHPTLTIQVDQNLVLETDLLRWMFLVGSSDPKWMRWIDHNITGDDFRVSECKQIYQIYRDLYSRGEACDLLSIGSQLPEGKSQEALSQILHKRVNLQKAEEGVEVTLRQLLNRKWMEAREAIKHRIHLGGMSEEQMLELAKEFDRIKHNPPQVVMLT